MTPPGLTSAEPQVEGKPGHDANNFSANTDEGINSMRKKLTEKLTTILRLEIVHRIPGDVSRKLWATF